MVYLLHNARITLTLVIVGNMTLWAWLTVNYIHFKFESIFLFSLVTASTIRSYCAQYVNYFDTAIQVVRKNSCSLQPMQIMHFLCVHNFPILIYA